MSLFIGELLSGDLTVIGLALWTLVSGFIGALLGAAGKAAGYDCYNAVKERYHKRKYGYNYTDSELQQEMKSLASNLRKMDYEMGEAVSYNDVNKLYYNWKESLERYETDLQDKFEIIIRELDERDEFHPYLADEEREMLVYLQEIERWESKFDRNWGSPEDFFHDSSLMTREKDPRGVYQEQRLNARNALEDFADKIDEVRRDIEWENQGNSPEEQSDK